MAERKLESLIIPQFFPAHWLEEAPDLVSSEFHSRVKIGYVVRIKGGYSSVMRKDVEESGLSLEALHDAAVQNLLSRPLPELVVGKTPGGPEAWLRGTEDNFNAARILLPIVQKALAANLGEPYFFILPCRDWFVAWSTAQAAEWQAKNMAEALRIFREDDHNLTPDVLQFDENRFTLGIGQPPDT
jgi:hypothetical protein